MHRPFLIGLGFALAAYVTWGVLPLYWALLRDVNPLEVLAHRIIWTLPFAGLMVQLGRQWGVIVAVLRQPRQLGLLAATALLIALNWGLYIWAVANSRVVEASLGYYLTPLVSVLLGIIVFSERPRPLQWLAVVLAAAGVGLMLVAEGMLPWVSLTLAGSFGLYGALRKYSQADSSAGLLIETALLAPFCLGWVAWLWVGGQGAFANLSLGTDLLLIGSGIATALPMLWYVAGARRLPLTTVGVLFYLNPTIQFLLGVLVFGEPLSMPRLYTFGLIWLGIALYISDGLRRRKRQKAVIPLD